MNAKRNALVVGATLGLACAVSTRAVELTAEEVIARCVAALGGHQRWRAIETLEFSGTHSSFSRQRPFLLRRQRPNLFRFDHNASGHERIIAHDGEISWWKRTIQVATKGSWPVPAPLSYAGSIAAEAEFEVPFLCHRERGHRLKFLGQTELDTTPCYEFEVTYNNGVVQHWYLDVESFLPIARVATVTYFLLPHEERTYYSDYREIAGVMIPHHHEQEVGGDFRTLDVERVRFNVEIDPRVFALPPPTGMEKLRTLPGHWNVKARSRISPEAPWRETSGASVIRADFHDAFLEERMEIVAADFPLEVLRLFSYDRFRDCYRIAHFDNATAHLDILEGGFANGRLVVSDIPTGTTWEVYGRTTYTRLVYHDFEDNSFALDVEISHDGGDTWITDQVLTYIRVQAR